MAIKKVFLAIKKVFLAIKKVFLAIKKVFFEVDMRPTHVLFVCLSLTSYAAAQNAPTVKQAESACGPSHVNFHVDENANRHPLAPVIAGKAQVYLIEDWVPLGVPAGAPKPIVRVGMDGQWIGADKGDSYLFFAVGPGERHLCVNWQPGFLAPPHSTTALYAFDAKPHKIYFFRARMPDLPNGSGILLEPLNIDEALLLIAQYPHATSSVAR
ncbi:MAG: hypothetical protein ACYDC6_11660 [Acidobacteriaceae bacterium]